MPKVQIPRTRAEELRHVAGKATRKYDDARAAWEAFSEEVDAVRNAGEAAETHDLASLAEQVGSLRDAIQELVDAGATVQGLDELTEATDAINSAAENLGLDTDALSTFTEAYDELESALDTYEEYRESGSGYSREDREGAWETVVQHMESLADAADALGFDFVPAEVPTDEPAS
jgi:chromosome segregation ATPase